jgi:two-component system sensor histidine kinase KdpD
MDRLRSSEQRIKTREEIVKERYRGNLLRAISHDLRTPLSCIIGSAEMIMDMSESNETQRSLAEDIHNEADWLHAMVENILSLTRLQDGSLSLKKQVEAIEEIVGAAAAHIAKRFPNYDIRVSMPDELIMAPVDAKLIEQVLINLLENAVSHSKPENEISVSVEKSEADNTVRITVADGGTGIAAADLPHIFQMFYTSQPRHGIGLGLSICETIIKAHEGRIEAKNRADGAGAEFNIELPMEASKNGAE